MTQPQQRMVYTLKTAGRATFLTSFTTAAAYAANAFSQVWGVRVAWAEGTNMPIVMRLHIRISFITFILVVFPSMGNELCRIRVI